MVVSDLYDHHNNHRNDNSNNRAYHYPKKNFFRFCPIAFTAVLATTATTANARE